MLEGNDLAPAFSIFLALQSLFGGYHPDAKWEVKETEVVEDNEDSHEGFPVDSVTLGNLVADLHSGTGAHEGGQGLEMVADPGKGDFSRVPTSDDPSVFRAHQ